MFHRLHFHHACYRSTKPLTKWRSNPLHKRVISSPSSSHHHETISIPVGGNGTFYLDISRPIHPAKNNNVLVYLPPGPLLPSTKPIPDLFDAEGLSGAFPDTTIVTVQYRVSLSIPSSKRDGDKSQAQAQAHEPRHARNLIQTSHEYHADYRFPTPIHDVFTAWEYITGHLDLHNHEIINGRKIHYRPRVCLLGERIGGSLALGIALTEPVGVWGVAIVDGVGDWTGIDEVVGEDVSEGMGDEEGGMEKVKVKVKEGGSRGGRGLGIGGTTKRRGRPNRRDSMREAGREMLRMRGGLFRSHSGYFDAFASPVSFLRAPGRDTPTEGGIGGEVNEVADSDVESGYGSGSVNERGAYGPYDDDWDAHAHEYGYGHGHEGVHGLRPDGRPDVPIASTTETRLHGPNGTDASSLNHGEHNSSFSSSTTSEQNPIRLELLDSPIQPPTSPPFPPSPASPRQPPPPHPTPLPRRRKVLRRWPPTTHPEDTLLPPINIFTTPPTPPAQHTASNGLNHPDTVDITPILSLQASEMQELLRKACFWGRERGLAEERVVTTGLRGVRGDGEGKDRDREKVVEWLTGQFERGER